MDHRKARLIVLGGAFVMLLAVGALTATAAPAAQEEPPPQEGEAAGPPNLGADYMGASVCKACHADAMKTWQATAHASFVKEASTETVLGDLTDEAAVTITWPDGESRPITLEDITYVLGGRYMQRYISVQTRQDGAQAFYVLPVQWNIPQVEGQEGKWTPYHPDDWAAPERDWRAACAGCHVTGLTAEEVAEGWDIKKVELNVSCEACHGPGGEHIKKPTENKMVSSPDAQVCGQCHIQGADPSGEHGYPVGYQPGMPFDESVFVPAGAEDAEVWWPSGHAKTYNTYSEWLTSGHASALEDMKASELAEDSCLRCHAPDTASTGATASVEGAEAAALDLAHAEFGVTCTACHNLHPEVDEAGNLVAEWPALLRGDLYETCVGCHSCCSADSQEPLLVGGKLHYPVQALFEGWPVIEGIEGIPSAHFEVMGEESCTTCHMVRTVQIGEYGQVGTHTMNVVFPGEAAEGQPDSCNGCHDNVSPEAMQQFIENTQDSVARRLRDAGEALQSATDVPAWVVKAVEFVGTDGSLGIHNFAYTDALLYAVETELGIVETTAERVFAAVTVEDPAQCGTCHRDIHDMWATSPHANASLSNVFLQDLAQRGSPTYCMRCHASGYDPDTEQYVFEGVVCSSCHSTINGAAHPPAPMQAANTSELCGQCHSGAHAPTYNEWLASMHRTKGVDCMDCHTPHNNGLILGDVNTTCGTCHPEALTDEVHMGENMDCVDCHMTRKLDADGIHVVATGHSMSIAPETCAACHGSVHVLTASEEPAPVTPEERSRIAELVATVAQLEQEAQTNWNTGVVGGAIGMFIVAVAAVIILRRRK